MKTKKQKQVTKSTVKMDHSNLFASPKQGGILQSSGFLDLKSLMSLSRTAKAHVLDELSLIQLIENEITRNHGVKTMEQAIVFWRELQEEHRQSSQWTGITKTTVMLDMLFDAACRNCEVMLVKMLHSVPQSERLRLVKEKDEIDRTLLHYAADSGNVEVVMTILNLYPESERLGAVCLKDQNGRNAFHCAAYSGNHNLIKWLLSSLPELQQLQHVHMIDMNGMTVLHHAVCSGNTQSIDVIWALYPEADRLGALLKQNHHGRTTLHCAALCGKHESLRHILNLLSGSQCLLAAEMKTRNRETVLHDAARSNNSGPPYSHHSCSLSRIRAFTSCVLARHRRKKCIALRRLCT